MRLSWTNCWLSKGWCIFELKACFQDKSFFSSLTSFLKVSFKKSLETKVLKLQKLKTLFHKHFEHVIYYRFNKLYQKHNLSEWNTPKLALKSFQIYITMQKPDKNMKLFFIDFLVHSVLESILFWENIWCCWKYTPVNIVQYRYLWHINGTFIL